MINDACVLLKKPFSHAGIIRFQGQTTTYVPADSLAGNTNNLRHNAYLKEEDKLQPIKRSSCYRCVFPKISSKDIVPTCSRAGLPGVVPGVIGTIQATEALKYILGICELLMGFLLTFDVLSMTF